MILLIGLDDKDSSPIRVEENFWADNIPLSNLIDVPELPKLISFLGSFNPYKPEP
jgi:hypothetical protein